MGVRGARAQLATDVEAVLLRQHHVEQHEVGREGCRPWPAPRAVDRGLHFVAFELEIVAQAEGICGSSSITRIRFINLLPSGPLPALAEWGSAA